MSICVIEEEKGLAKILLDLDVADIERWSGRIPDVLYEYET